MAFVRASDGTNLFYRDWGRGEPFVFVGSQSLPSDIWSSMLPRFIDRGLRCVSFDRRGHGRSDQPTDGYDIDSLANDLGAIVEQLDLRGVTLVGHSLGGAEAVRYTARRGSGRVRRLALLAPTAPFLKMTEDNPVGFEPAAVDALRREWTNDFPRWVEENARPFFAAGTSAALVRWGAALMTQLPLFVHLQVARTTVETDLRADLRQLEVPSLFLHGELDVSVPYAFGQLAASMVRGSVFRGFPDAAHGLLVTHAEQVTEDILGFVRLTTP